MEKRKAAVAGSFYPRYEPDLLRIIKESFTNKKYGPGEEFQTLNKDERSIIGGVSPHAGYVYSGCAAAYTFLNLFKEKIPDTVIILGNDHIGYGRVGLMKEGIWETPLGDINIDSEVTQEILSNSRVIIEDNSAFMGFPFGREHNIEVQLPFIKFCAGDKDIKIVPIKVASHNMDVLKTISNDIANSIKALDKDIIIVASSDMSHEEVRSKDELKTFKERDQNLIEGFEKFNPETTLEPYPKASICGRQTITSLILTCINLNAKSAKKLIYYTSSEKTGNIGGYCVGYFSGIISK
jgi:AmmeMemoRadiSam system protein B